jgi:hypothetical protein
VKPKAMKTAASAGGEPARWVFEGVRKLALCQDSEARPRDGTEVSYIQLRVRSEAALRKLVNSERVSVEYLEELGAEEGGADGAAHAPPGARADSGTVKGPRAAEGHD